MLILGQAADLEGFAPLAAGLFYALAALTALSAWAIVLSQNIVRMALYLLLTLAGVAGLYFLLSAEFLAAIQLIVYAGGTLILIVFGVMLTSKNPFLQLRTAPWERAAGVLLGVVIASILLVAMVGSGLRLAGPMPAVAADGGAGGVAGAGYVASIGKLLLGEYLVPFEIAAVLLLVVMIGAAFMARKRTRDEGSRQ